MKELKVILRYTKPYRWLLLLATLSMILMTVMNMIGPWMIRSLIQTVTDSVNTMEESYMAKVSRLAALAVVVYMVRAAAQFGADYISHYSAWHMLNEIRQDLYDHMQTLAM